MASWRLGRRAAAGRRRPVLAAFAGLLVLLVLAAAAVALSRASLAAAEAERIAERTRLVQRVAEYTASTYTPDRVQAAAFRTPFPQDDPALAARLLQQFRTSSIGDTASAVALVRRDGSVVASVPAGARLPLAALRAEIGAALQGTAAMSGAFDDAGTPSWAVVSPVGFDRWAALVVVQPAANTSAQLFVSRLGSLGSGPGGISWLDRDGRALLSWDRQLLGRVVDPPRPAGSAGRPVVTTSGDGADQFTTVSLQDGSGRTTIFRQHSDAMFADLRAQQRQRYLTLLGVVAIAVLALFWASVRRLRGVRRGRARLDALLRNTQDIILVTSATGELTFVSPAVATVLGRHPQRLLGGPISALAHPEDAARLEELIADPGGIGAIRDVRLTSADGRPQWFDVEAVDASGNPDLRGVLLTCHEIGRRKALQDALLRQARHDSLTGLPNRTVLTAELTERLLGWDGAGAAPGLLFVDLDRFKPVNDTYGHAAGDRVLCAVAERLVAAVADEGVVCRFGGDEFGIVLSGTDRDAAERLARAVVESLGRAIDIRSVSPGAGGVVLGASVGLALAGPGLRDADALLRAADEAMYRAKHEGRGRFAVHAGPVAAGDPGIGPAVSPDGEPAPPEPMDRPRRAAAAERPDVATTGSPATAPGRPRLAALGSLAAAVVAIVSVAGFGVLQTAQARDDAERQRLAERLQLTARVAQYATAIADPAKLLRPVNDAPWALDGSLVDRLVLQAVLASGIGGEGGRAALYSTTGRVVLSAGPELPPGATPGSAAWRTALDGAVGFVPLVQDGGIVYGSYAVPVVRAGRPAAVLVIAQQLDTSMSQRMLEVLGSLGFGEGGVISVERGGRATHAWDRRLIGTRVFDPAVLAALPVGRASVAEGPAGQVTLAAPLRATRASDSKVIVLRQPTAAFYGDLRSGQTRRDLILLALVLASTALLLAAGIQRELALRRAERRLHALFQHSHDIVAVFDQGNPTFVSSAVGGLLSHRPQDLLHRPWAAVVHPDDLHRLAAYEANPSGTLEDVRLRHADGSYRWFDVHAADLRGDAALRGVVVTCHEVGERRALQQELSRRARHDALTGLLTRDVFLERLYEVAARPDRLPWSVLYLDLDGFKPVNDTFGHDVGDVVLRVVAERLTGAVPAEAAVCRLGGDEFAVLLTGPDVARSEGIADTLLEQVGQPIPLPAPPGEATSARVGVTIGIAVANGQSPDEVLRDADLAMYQGKQAGRGRYAVHG